MVHCTVWNKMGTTPQGQRQRWVAHCWQSHSVSCVNRIYLDFKLSFLKYRFLLNWKQTFLSFSKCVLMLSWARSCLEAGLILNLKGLPYKMLLIIHDEEGFFFFFFLPRPAACGILVPRPGIEPAPPAVEAWSPNHQTAREVAEEDI